MKRNTKYVGLDVHQAMTVATVRSQGGRVIARSVVETGDASITAYQPSTRSFPSKLTTPDYPAHFEVRKVSTNGGIRWHSRWINVSHLLGGDYIGLEEIDHDVWAVYFGPVSLGWLIGIGEDRRSRSFPSHTTRHAGPHLAVR